MKNMKIQSLADNGREKGSFIFAVLSLTVVSGCQIAFALLLSQMVQAVQVGQNRLLLQAIIFSMLTIVGEVVFRHLGNFFAYRYCMMKTQSFKNICYVRSLIVQDEADLSMFTAKADLVNTAFYFNKVYRTFYAIQIVATSAVLLYLHVTIFVYLFFLTGALLGLPHITKKKVEEKTQGYTQETGRYLRFLTNVMEGKDEVCQYGAVKAYEVLHNEKNHAAEYKRYGYQCCMSAINALSGACTSMGFLGLMALVGFLAIQGKLSIGSMLSVVQLMNYFIGPMMSLIACTNQMNSVKKEIALKQEPMAEVNIQNPREFTGEIVLKNLAYQYPREHKIAYPPAITIEKSKKYAVVGQSGCGKSTLAKILSGKLTDYSGTIQVDGVACGHTQLTQMVRYVPQSHHLFYDTVQNNIAMYQQIEPQKMFDLLGQINLPLEQDFLSKEIQTETTISGGERARVVLARALAHIPQVLIVDEPTANLDYENKCQIIKLLCGLPEVTVVVITHEQDEQLLKNFDGIIAL